MGVRDVKDGGPEGMRRIAAAKLCARLQEGRVCGTVTECVTVPLGALQGVCEPPRSVCLIITRGVSGPACSTLQGVRSVSV